MLKAQNHIIHLKKNTKKLINLVRTLVLLNESDQLAQLMNKR